MSTVRQLLARKGDRILSIGPDATVYEAVRRMAAHRVGALAVVRVDEGPRGDDEEGHGRVLLGMIDERDYARRIVLEGRRSRETLVRDAMRAPAPTIALDSELRECMEVMTERRVRHLPVIEGELLVGLVSIGDAVAAILAQQESLIEQLEGYITRR